MTSPADSRARQSAGQAYIRPASDDSVPLREHLEKLIEDLRMHFDNALVAQAKRFDDLRTTDKVARDAEWAANTKAVEAAFASAAKAVETALQSTRADAVRSDAVAEKRFSELNDMRKAVATSAEVDAVKGVAAAQQRALDKLESKFEAQQAAVAGRAGGLKDYIGWIAFSITVISSLVGFALLLRK